jgi:galactokinase
MSTSTQSAGVERSPSVRGTGARIADAASDVRNPCAMLRLFVPGRLCLLGEHSDWAGTYRAADPTIAPGRCLVTGTEQGLEAEAEPLAGAVELWSRLSDGSARGPERFPADAASLAGAARAGGFFSYAAGVAAVVAERHPVGGLRLRIGATDLPIGKGLSSSAAVCVLVARAYGRLYGLELSPRDEMELAYLGERRAGSACGRMDQVCAFGRRTLCLTFDGDALEMAEVAPAGRFELLVVDLRRGKDTRRILADLRACFPATPGALAAGVREALGARNAELVARASAALIAGDARALGEVMIEAQRVFDRLVAPACPELAAPGLHALLAHPAVGELAWGGKGVGSQGDGCAQLVARGPEERTELAGRLERDLEVACLPLTIDAAK